MHPSKVSFKTHIITSLKAAFLGYMVFGPITGMVLDGYDYTTHPMRPLTIAGIIFCLRFVLSFFEDKFKNRAKSPGVLIGESWVAEILNTRAKKLAVLVLFFVVFLSLPFFVGKYVLTVMITALIYVLLGLGLNIVVGFAGLLDLGFVAFYAVGAYGYALGWEYLGIGFWGAIPLAALAAGIFGAILGFPVLRMHGDYLAIVTLGFGEIIRLVLTNWVEFTGGPNGIKAPYINFFGIEFTRRPKYGGTPFHELVGIDYDSIYRYVVLYTVLLIFVVATTYAVSKVKNLSIGRAWEALREDEIACRSLGINHVVVKLSAFSMGAAIGGISGAFFCGLPGVYKSDIFHFF